LGAFKVLKRWKQIYKHWVYKKFFPFLIVQFGQGLMRLLLLTCRWEVRGLNQFEKTAHNQKCILMLWHNRLALTPFILYKYAAQFTYAAFVSNSRDGELISAIVESYKIGKTIRVPHNSRSQALRTLIAHLKSQSDIIVITPDGPRGPCYELKPGVALAALETSAYVVALNWTSNRLWTLKTWDKLRIPKPFSTITVSFKKAINFPNDHGLSLLEAQAVLSHSLLDMEEAL
jgi:lysophospholipid acyltransferase (LPLAT)-like uncharacterized protein